VECSLDPTSFWLSHAQASCVCHWTANSVRGSILVPGRGGEFSPLVHCPGRVPSTPLVLINTMGYKPATAAKIREALKRAYRLDHASVHTVAQGPRAVRDPPPRLPGPLACGDRSPPVALRRGGLNGVFRVAHWLDANQLSVPSVCPDGQYKRNLYWRGAVLFFR